MGYDEAAVLRIAELESERDIARDLLCEVWETECMQESGWMNIFAKVKTWYEDRKCRS